MSTKRVSRYFAMGFRCAELERTEGQLPMGQCENDWQKEKLLAGYRARMDGPPAHVQFWMVEGDARGSHAEIEEKISTAKACHANGVERRERKKETRSE